MKAILGGHTPYDVQAKLQKLSAANQGTLTVLESPTGSGKTEAAVGRYARLLQEGLVDSMYFAVLTRAAAKQLHKRLQDARNQIFGSDEPPVHLAVPGYLKVDDFVDEYGDNWNVRWDEDVGRRGWAVESSKRYTSSPIAVGTIDQVLLAGLKSKHAHLRLAGLARSFLVDQAPADAWRVDAGDVTETAFMQPARATRRVFKGIEGNASGRRDIAGGTRG